MHRLGTLTVYYTECVEANGVPRDQGTGYHGRRCDYSYEQYYEGHAAKFRGHLQTELYPCIMPNHRCKVLTS